MAATLSDEAFFAILAAHPGLRDRFVSIAMAVVDSEGNLKEADAAEERIVEARGSWGGRRCRVGARTRWPRRRSKSVNSLGCIAKVKKTPLAYEIWRDRSFRTAISV